MSIYYNKLFIIWNHSIVPKIYWESFRLQLMSCSWPKNHIFKLVDWTKIFTLLFLSFCAAYLLQETKCSLGSNNAFIPCSLLSPSLAVKRLIMSLFRPVLCLQIYASFHMRRELCSHFLGCSLYQPLPSGRVWSDLCAIAAHGREADSIHTQKRASDPQLYIPMQGSALSGFASQLTSLSFA